LIEGEIFYIKLRVCGEKEAEKGNEEK